MPHKTSISLFHAHLYYDSQNLQEAKDITVNVHRLFGLAIGHMHQQPVGPHPGWSCQITVPTEKFAEVVLWLSFNRGSVDVFVHPETGDPLADHESRMMWLGRSYTLNLEIFREQS